MRTAQDIIKSLQKALNIDDALENQRWDFLNIVLMGIVSDPKLNFEQTNLVESILSEVRCGQHDKSLKDRRVRSQWAMQFATWINDAHVANRIG